MQCPTWALFPSPPLPISTLLAVHKRGHWPVDAPEGRGRPRIHTASLQSRVCASTNGGLGWSTSGLNCRAGINQQQKRKEETGAAKERWDMEHSGILGSSRQSRGSPPNCNGSQYLGQRELAGRQTEAFDGLSLIGGRGSNSGSNSGDL